MAGNIESIAFPVHTVRLVRKIFANEWELQGVFPTPSMGLVERAYYFKYKGVKSNEFEENIVASRACTRPEGNEGKRNDEGKNDECDPGGITAF